MMDAFEYHVLLGSRETAESGRRMIQDLKKLPENGDRRTGVRIAWVHVLPYWQKAMTDGSAALAARAFEEDGFPTLTLDGDGCDPRNIQEGQMLTRVQAFIEQLEARKK